MMHPTLVAALAAEHHADLLRAAETHRRAAALARRNRPTSTHRLTDALTRLVAAFRTRAATSTQPAADLCCA